MANSVEVSVQVQAESGEQVVALVFPGMPLAIKGDKPVTAVALSPSEAREVARLLVSAANQIEALADRSDIA